MRSRKKAELNVDFIGGMGSLTKEEEKRISDFIKSRKTKQKSTPQKLKRRQVIRKKESA